MNAQVEENAAFIPGVKYFSRLLCRIIKAQSPQYKYQISWGPGVTHGLSTIASPPAGSQAAFDKLTSYIRWWRPGINVRVEAGTHIVTVAEKTFPLDFPEQAYPSGSPYDPLPDPYPQPVYCWPCSDTVFTA